MFHSEERKWYVDRGVVYEQPVVISSVGCGSNRRKSMSMTDLGACLEMGISSSNQVARRGTNSIKSRPSIISNHRFWGSPDGLIVPVT